MLKKWPSVFRESAFSRVTAFWDCASCFLFLCVRVFVILSCFPRLDKHDGKAFGLFLGYCVVAGLFGLV